MQNSEFYNEAAKWALRIQKCKNETAKISHPNTLQDRDHPRKCSIKTGRSFCVCETIIKMFTSGIQSIRFSFPLQLPRGKPRHI